MSCEICEKCGKDVTNEAHAIFCCACADDSKWFDASVELPTEKDWMVLTWVKWKPDEANTLFYSHTHKQWQHGSQVDKWRRLPKLPEEK